MLHNNGAHYFCLTTGPLYVSLRAN